MHHSAPSRRAGGVDPAASERALAHARALRSRGGSLPPEGRPAPEILDSWLRCLDRGLDFARAPRIDVVDAAEVGWRRERADFVRRLAQAELETLAQQIAGSNHLLAFADRDGVILDLYADNRFRMSGAAAGIAVGGCWSEDRAGTNGLGTALMERRPVAVTGLEHFHLSLGDVSCAAAPILDAAGELVGVLDASSYFESRQRHTHALVQMAASHIENRLLLHQMRDHLVLAIHPRAEFLGTLSVGLLAFDGAGVLAALNSRGRGMLAGLDAVPGVRFESLFGERFAILQARLARQDELTLRDALGSSIVGRCVARPAGLVAAVSPAPAAVAPEVPLAPAVAPRAAPIAAEAVRRSARIDVAATASNPSAAPAPAPGFVAEDPQVREACRRAEAALRLAAPILLVGESGSGKELLARHLHRASGRRGAFVAVNCGALPAELFEAELFGYVGGAFTGARREGSAGLAVAADGGTLLLDEVRDLPLPLQAALLRFLDDRLVRPVGGVQPRRVDVQIVAATNVDPARDVDERRLRADLMYRLDTVRVELPPLRARCDFASAVRFLLAEIDPAARIEPEAVQRLARHGWPGNFRELRAVLTRALLAGDGLGIGVADVETLLPAAAGTAAGPVAASALQQQATGLIRRELERCGGSVSEAARRLGISRTTIYRHLRTTPTSGR
ncbi:MAG: sigma-54-dependent Fis family transcriptional regulator [Pseudomonadota bacterium]